MSAILRCGAFVAITVTAAACGTPTAPTPRPVAASSPTVPSPAVPVPAPSAYTPSFPPVSGPARVYVAVSWPYSSYHGSPLASRFVFYEDGTFALQYSSANHPFFEYRGTYAEANALVTFVWEGWSIAGPWGATASLQGDSLTVWYNLIMQLSDFEDGMYVRSR